jgi:uncharacterized protein (TIGR00661 family)
MTQALALKRILEEAGHEVVAGFVGENPARPVPRFFLDRFDAPTHLYVPPVFVVDRQRKGVRIWASLLSSLRQIPLYWSQGPQLHQKMLTYAPDLLVNFYETLGAFYHVAYRPKIPVVAVGNQFLFLHPAYPTPVNASFQVGIARLHARMTSMYADLRLGLSFKPLPSIPDSRLRIVPPLIRDAVLSSRTSRGDHLLAYVLNPGYGEELERWHESHKEVVLHCFWDKMDAPPSFSPHENLTFHRLDDRKFLDLLVSCRGFTGTAGFQSACEAAFLEKPTLLVPTENHIEQRSNALEAQRAGVAVCGETFDLTDLLKVLDAGTSWSHEEFGSWVRSAPESFLRLLEGLCSGLDPMKIPLPSDHIPSLVGPLP